MCIVDLEEAFERVSRKIMVWAMRKKEIPEMMVNAVTILYKEATTKIKVEFGYSLEFHVKVGVHQGSVLSLFFVASVIDVITEGLFHETLYADDLVFMNDSIKDI